MGFRTTIISEHIYGIKLPEWFKEKHYYLSFGENNTEGDLPFATKYEVKTYSAPVIDLFTDFQKCLKELDWIYKITIVLLHENGDIAKVLISNEKISILEPTDYIEVEELTLNG